MRDSNRRGKGFSRLELLLSLIFLAMFLMIGYSSKVIAGSRNVSQVNNAKQILTGCALYAADVGRGKYPNGTYDPDNGSMDPNKQPAKTAEGCFQDMFGAGILELETLFWNPKNGKQCSQDPPNGDDKLEAGENYWDYVSGLKNTDVHSFPTRRSSDLKSVV